MSAAKSRTAPGGALWAAQIRREFDLLAQAMNGVGISSLIQTLATEAVFADDGTLKTSVGEPGYSWNPDAASRKRKTDPVKERINSAAASLGRVLGGGQCDHRAYLAFLAAFYEVKTSQDQDITARIEALWERHEQHVAEEETIEAEKQGVLGRVWAAIVSWFKTGWMV
jgi:hypothetical protein